MSIHFPGISFNEADDQILLVSLPSDERQLVDAAELRALLVQEGFGDCKIDSAALESAAKMCNVQETAFGIQVASRLDAELLVRVVQDDMTALLTIIPPMGGAPATLADVLNALRDAKVVFGIDQAAITAACQAPKCENVVIASGALPQDGADAQFEELTPETTDRAPKVDANGLIDYRERGAIPAVKAGDPLMRRIPARPGIDGSTVKGRVLAAKPGHDKTFTAALKGSEISKEDPELLVATIGGQPVRVDCGVNVEPILKLREVNMATGNIHFDGSVHVAGEVVQGMKVYASGDIVVDGMVDSGILEAEGDIRIAGGIIAKAQVRAKGSVTARFAEGVLIEAGTAIMIKDMALECELHSLNQILIGARRNGRLIGGSTTAMMLLRVAKLGSAKAGTTKVVMATNPALDEKYAELLKRLAEEEAVEVRLEKLIRQLKNSGDPQGMLERATVSWQHAVKTWSKSLAERAEVEKELEVMKAARLEVSDGTEGAVDLSFGKLTAKLRRDFEPGVFSIEEESGQMVYTGSKGVAIPLTY